MRMYVWDRSGIPVLTCIILVFLAAVVQEMQNQRATLKKQREDYQRRASALTRELKILREQRNKLAAVNQPHSPTTRNFLKENDRLQVNREKCARMSLDIFIFVLFFLQKYQKFTNDWEVLLQSDFPPIF